MKLLNIIIVALFLTLIFHVDVCKAEEYNYSIGGILGYDIDSHSARFSKLPNQESVGGVFNDGTGSSFNFGVVLDYRISESLFLSTRLTLSNKKSEMTATEFIGYAEYNNERFPVYSNHLLETELGVFQISPSIKYNLSENLPIVFNVGLGLGFMSNSTFVMSQTLDQNSIDKGFQYLLIGDELTNSIDKSGNIEGMNTFMMSGFGAVSYQYEIGELIYLVPEISYLLNLIGPVADTNWKINSLEFSIAFMFAF